MDAFAPGIRITDVEPRDPLRVSLWRRDFASSLGFDDGTAAMLATARIDLHAIEALTSGGCPAALALSIVR
jgi:hypothetical protein